MCGSSSADSGIWGVVGGCYFLTTRGLWLVGVDWENGLG